jgi:hypothetical protein
MTDLARIVPSGTLARPVKCGEARICGGHGHWIIEAVPTSECWRTMFARTAALAVTSTFGLAAPAFANDTLQLTWRAPAECPSADSVRRAAVRDTTTVEPTGVLVADARVEPMENSEMPRWRVTLRTRRGAVVGERTIEASSCDGVADATAIVLGLALTSAVSEVDAAPSTRIEPVEPLEPIASVASRESIAPVSAAVPPSPRRSTAVTTIATLATLPAARDTGTGTGTRVPSRSAHVHSHSFGLGLSVAADTSSLPLPALGGSLTLAWTAGRVRAELDVRRWASQSRTLDPFSAGARFSMTSLGARGCWRALGNDGTALDASACSGADIHFVSAPGYGVDPDYDARARWIAVAGGGLVRFSLAPWLELRTRVEAYAPLSRPTFVLEGAGAGPLHRPSALGAAGSLGLELLFL